MAVPFSNTKLRVPKGFQNILESLAREVLRSQPENIFEFGATYFENALRNRTETGYDIAEHGARLEDRTYNNHAFKKPGVDPSSPQQQEAAVKIQTQYRQHSAQQAVAEMREEDAAIKIQAGFRGYIDRQEVKKRKDGEPETKAGEEEEEVDIDLNDPEVEKAALKIQAGFKGFKARKEVQTKQEGGEPAPEPEPEAQKEEEVDIDLNDPEVSKAALKIQSGFRGHMARQEIRQKKTATEEPETTPADSQPAPAQEEEEEVDIDLTDPEVEKAAIKIQAGFKGFKSRKAQQTEQDSTKEAAGSTEAPPAAEEGKQAGKTEEEEEIDIDLDDPETEKAALKIQAGFRGFKARKEISQAPGDEKADSSLPSASDYQPKNKKAEEADAPAADQSGEATGTDATQQEEEVDIDLEDPEVEKAAIKIQAGFKGFKVRKGLKDDSPTSADAASDEGKPAETEEKPAEETKPAEGQGQEEEEVDIDLADPEVEKAALKIQAGYKGFKTRKEVKGKMEEKSEEQTTEKTEETAATEEKQQEEAETGEKTEEGETEQKTEEQQKAGEEQTEGTTAEGETQKEGTAEDTTTEQTTTQQEAADEQKEGGEA